MPNSGTNIIFFGTEAFSLAALEALVDAGYTVAAVVTKPDSPSGRGMQLREPAVKAYAKANGIRVLQPERLADIEAELSQISNRIGVLSSYGKIIPESTLALFERGIVNIHPSLLPAYRGPAPIETAIMNGDAQTGVSLMRLVASMDAGPVYVQKTIELISDTTAQTLYTLCAQTGATLLIESLPSIIKNELIPHGQNESVATYTKLLNKKDAYVDPATQTADEIERHIRAYELFPRTRLIFGDNDVIITKAHVGRADESGICIPCAENSALILDELIAPSGKKMSAADYSRGYTV